MILRKLIWWYNLIALLPIILLMFLVFGVVGTFSKRGEVTVGQWIFDFFESHEPFDQWAGQSSKIKSTRPEHRP